MKRYPNLDLLRLFLALEVVVVHLRMDYDYSPAFNLLPPVATFVCLSGFLIPKSFTESRSYGHFAWKRILRVMPGMVLSIVLACSLFGWRFLGGTLLYYLTIGIIRGGANPPLWSLMLEELLYAFHSLARTILKVLWNPYAVAALMVGFLILASYSSGDTQYKLLVASAFFGGNMLRLNIAKVERLNPWIPLLSLASVSLTLALVWNSGANVPLLGLIGSACGVAIAFRLPQIKAKHFPDASYGIYVYHSPFIVFGVIHHASILFQCCVIVPLVIALSYASWYLIEKPVLKAKDRPWQFPKKSPEPRVSEAVA